MTEVQAGSVDIATEVLVVGAVLPMLPEDAVAGLPFRTPEAVLDSIASGSCRAAGASLVGLGHLASGGCRQDAFGLFSVAPDRLCVVLADGLGSRPISQLGAHLFVESVGLLLGAGEDEPAGAADLLRQASERVAHLTTTGYRRSVDDVSCVGLVALITPTGVDLARVGDVTAFTVAGSEFTEIGTDAEKYVNIVTHTLSEPDLTDHIESFEIPATPIMCLATDGLAADIRNSPMVRSWLGERWRRPATAFALGDSLRFRRQGSHDDRTGVVVWRGGDPT